MSSVKPKSKGSPHPWMPTPYTVAQAAAIRACASGAATDQQQRVAMEFIVKNLCGTYDLEYRPGSDGARESSFAGGKRWVGLQIVKLVNFTVRSEPNEQPE